MNREKAIEIMDNISDRLISESAAFNDKAAGKGTVSRYRRPAVIAAVLAVMTCLMCAGIIAYAENYYGIRDLFSGPRSEWRLSDEAGPLIEHKAEVSASDNITVRITETLCDAYTVLTTVDIRCDENYFLVPLNDNKHTQNIDLQSSMSLIGFDTDDTVAEYAARHGKKPLRISGYTRGDGCDPGIKSDWSECVFRSDNELTMLIRTYKTVSMDVCRLRCLINVQDLSRACALDEGIVPPPIYTIDIPFEAVETETELVGVYVPADPETVPGILLDDVTVTRSVLGVNVLIPVKPIQGSDMVLHTTLRCRDIEFSGGGFMWSETENDIETINTVWYMGKWEPSDTLVLQCWYNNNGSEPELLGEIIYKKKTA